MKKIILLLLCIISIFAFLSCSKNKDHSQRLNNQESSNEASVITPSEEKNDNKEEQISPKVTATTMPTMIPTATVTPEPTIDPKQQAIDENSAFTIVIDPGHQAHQNSEEEPIGPGAKETKPKVSSGTQGRFTGKPEYEVNLEVSLKLKDLLTEQGYKVIMVRETHDVNISNSKRAAIANDNHADVFVRIHCNGSENPAEHGALTMCPTKDNPYCGEIYEESFKLSDYILSSLCDITGSENRGILETDTMSGINWCEVPVTIVEMGYMTNEEEDKKLSDTEYQDKLAQGIADGISEYLKTE